MRRLSVPESGPLTAPDGPEQPYRIGVVTPYDFALDHEMSLWASSEQVSLHVTRMHAEPMPAGLESGAAGDRDIRWAVRDLMSIEVLAVAYACTSGSFASGQAGELDLCAEMRAGGAPMAVTTSGAMLDALECLGVGRVAVATPYPEDVTGRLREFLTEAGHEVVATSGLGLTREIWKVRYPRIADLVLAADRPEADAVFVSCTNLPTYHVIAPLEERLGKPVLSANQVTLWSVLRRLGLPFQGTGRLAAASAAPSTRSRCRPTAAR